MEPREHNREVLWSPWHHWVPSSGTLSWCCWDDTVIFPATLGYCLTPNVWLDLATDPDPSAGVEDALLIHFEHPLLLLSTGRWGRKWRHARRVTKGQGLLPLFLGMGVSSASRGVSFGILSEFGQAVGQGARTETSAVCPQLVVLKAW